MSSACARAEARRARNEQYVLGGAVVDEVGEEDADGDVELEQDVEPAADPRRGDLGQEQRNGLHGWSRVHDEDCFSNIDNSGRCCSSIPHYAHPDLLSPGLLI
jgi:hypothetical protein